jgi:hypothetical protein
MDKPILCKNECLICRIRCCGTCRDGYLFSNVPDISVLCSSKQMNREARFPRGQQITAAIECPNYKPFFEVK